jgi:protein SCO1/2
MTKGAMVALRAMLLIVALSPAAAATPGFDPFTSAAIEPKLGAALPESDLFLDDAGARVTLGDYLGRRPAIIAPIDVGCTNICGVTLAGLFDALDRTGLDPSTFTVLAVSIDPRDTPAAAKAWKLDDLKRYRDPRAPQAVHFLVSDGPSSGRLTAAMGFNYAYDKTTDQYAHPAAVAVVTPDGHLARWLYGYPFEPSDIRLALTEASAGTVGTLADRLWLLCYGYDPVTGAYTARVDEILRAGGGLTVLLLAGLVLMLVRRERREGSARS